jgi:preprotein translocase subunit SecE
LAKISKNMANKITQYLKDSKHELKKVIWPTKKQAINHTLLVIGFSLGLALFLGIIDFGLTKILEVVVK